MIYKITALYSLLSSMHEMKLFDINLLLYLLMPSLPTEKQERQDAEVKQTNGQLEVGFESGTCVFTTSNFLSLKT